MTTMMVRVVGIAIIITTLVIKREVAIHTITIRRRVISLIQVEVEMEVGIITPITTSLNSIITITTIRIKATRINMRQKRN
jgi:hypothetical protein